jgi:hypothetical protein
MVDDDWECFVLLCLDRALSNLRISLSELDTNHPPYISHFSGAELDQKPLTVGLATDRVSSAWECFGGRAMTEAEWFAATDPEQMLEFFGGKASERKLRLFACGCCRRVWHLLTDNESRAAVEVAERFADGLVPKRHLSAARSRARRWIPSFPDGASYIVWQAAFEKLPTVIGSIARRTIYCAAAHRGSSDVKRESVFMKLLRVALANPFRPVTINPCSSGVEQESAAVTALLREIVGNPFRPNTLNPSWLTSTVLALAQQMYDSRGFSPMPILADALQDAGCENEDILNHCRQPGEHVRGCWVVDHILSKC